MTKVALLLGLGVGFLLGSRAGRAPYEQLDAKVRRFTARPDVREVAVQAKEATEQTAQKAVAKINASAAAD